MSEALTRLIVVELPLDVYAQLVSRPSWSNYRFNRITLSVVEIQCWQRGRESPSGEM